MSAVALTVTIVLVFFLAGIAAGVAVVFAMSARRRPGRDAEPDEPADDEPEAPLAEPPWWESRDADARRLRIVSGRF